MKAFFLVVAVTFTFFTSAVAKVALGVYDFAGGFENANLDIENQFISWCQYQPGTVYNAIEGAASRRRELLLTLEPWSDGFFKSSLLKDVVAGKHDAVLTVVCADIRRAGRPLYVRWGHEMEQNFGRYPWSTKEPAAYVAAYRHVVLKMRSMLQGIPVKFIWSPAGNANARAYYPGCDVVDAIGLSVYSYAQWDRWVYGSPQSFKQLMDAKYHVASLCNREKPVIICEMGAYSASDPGYKARWVADALSVAHAHYYPQLKGLVWFNARDPASWGFAGRPDFRVSPAIWR
jgi:beta-mannanase